MGSSIIGGDANGLSAGSGGAATGEDGRSKGLDMILPIPIALFEMAAYV
jgi:hypothetical protein